MAGIASENGDIPDPEGLLPERDYKPDEIIMKFEKVVADSLAEQLSTGVPVGEITLTHSLDSLNSKYRLRNIEAVIKNFKKSEEKDFALAL
jgi:hypothetical protein